MGLVRACKELTGSQVMALQNLPTTCTRGGAQRSHPPTCFPKRPRALADSDLKAQFAEGTVVLAAFDTLLLAQEGQVCLVFGPVGCTQNSSMAEGGLDQVSRAFFTLRFSFSLFYKVVTSKGFCAHQEKTPSRKVVLRKFISKWGRVLISG